MVVKADPAANAAAGMLQSLESVLVRCSFSVRTTPLDHAILLRRVRGRGSIRDRLGCCADAGVHYNDLRPPTRR